MDIFLYVALGLLVLLAIGVTIQAVDKSSMNAMLNGDGRGPIDPIESMREVLRHKRERQSEPHGYYERLASREQDADRKRMLLELAGVASDRETSMEQLLRVANEPTRDKAKIRTEIELQEKHRLSDKRMRELYVALDLDRVAGVPRAVLAAVPSMESVHPVTANAPEIIPTPQLPDAFVATERYLSWDGSCGIAIDKERNSIALLTPHSRRIIAFADIVSSEVCTDGDTVVRSDFGSLIGRAAIGGFLFAGVGAIVGGVTGTKRHKKDVKSVELKVLTKGKTSGVHHVRFYGRGALTTSEVAIAEAGHWHDLMTIAMKETADAGITLPSVESHRSSSTLSSELGQLAELHRNGVLSEVEFTRAKKQLLG